MKEVHDYYTEDGEKIEYSITGKGIPILVLHGGHSNCQEEFGYEELVEQGYQIITPSRAGYGNTSPSIGKSLKTSCKAYLQLLNQLQIDAVHVISISAGGPSGIFFASQYPDRVKSLILQSAVTKEWLTSKDKAYKAAQVLFRPSLEKYTWKMISSFSKRFPKIIFKQMASSFSSLPYTEIQLKLRDEDFKKFIKMNSRQRSGHGFMIDLKQTSSVTISDLQAINCPTLILHSYNDSAVPIEHAYHASKHIQQAALCLLDTWGHLIWLGSGSEKVHEELLRFLNTV